MLIKSIEKDEKNASMNRVFLEDKSSFCLPKKRIGALNLEEGKELEPETLDYILSTEVYASAKSAAVSFLALKLRTSYEIEHKLTELGYEQDTIERVIESLIEINYIDDYKYAVKYLAEKSKLKPMSSKMLSMELGNKGISRDIISRAIDEFDFDEDSIAYDLLKKKYAKYTSFDEKTINKMRSFLMTRGFNYQQISKAISKFLPDDQM